MNDRNVWIPFAIVALMALTAPALTSADTICPECGTAVVPLALSEVIELLVSTILGRGVSVLVLGAVAAVALPWLIAGVAVLALSLPHRLKAWF